MIFLALKTEDGAMKGKIAFYCRMLGVSRQGFYKYLANKNRPWKYQDLADAMKEIVVTTSSASKDRFLFMTLYCKQTTGLWNHISFHNHLILQIHIFRTIQLPHS